MAVDMNGASAIGDATAVAERAAARPRFSDDTRKWLNGKPDLKKMDTLPRSGRDMPYIPWNVCAEMANKRFHPDGWMYEVTDETQTAFVGSDPNTGESGIVVGHVCKATVRITIWDEYGNPVVRQDVGSDSANYLLNVKNGGGAKYLAEPGQRMDMLVNAQKSAVSVGIRRAFRTFGDKFGLMLYDRPTAQRIAADIKRVKAGGDSASSSAGSSSSRRSSDSGGSAVGGGAVCPTHGAARVQENSYGYFCATRVSEGPDGKPIYCDEKPRAPEAAVAAPPRPAPPRPSPTPPRGPVNPPSRPAPSPSGGGYADGYGDNSDGYGDGYGADDQPDEVKYACPQHGAGSFIRPSKFPGGSGYWCTFRYEDGRQCKRNDMTPALMDDGTDPGASMAMARWDGITVKADVERDAALAEFYGLLANFGPSWDTPEKADANFSRIEGQKPVSAMSLDELREHMAVMRETLSKEGAAAGAGR